MDTALQNAPAEAPKSVIRQPAPDGRLHPFCSAVANDDDEMWEICGNCGNTRDYQEGSQDYCDTCDTPWCMSAGNGSKLRNLCDENDGRVPIGDHGRLDLPNAEHSNSHRDKIS
jgi:hypothetical protein